MSNDTKRYIACLLFGAAALGAFLPSYIHVAAYFAGAVPPEWIRVAYVGALALDVLAVACGYGLILTTPKAEGRHWLHAGLWAPVILSVWVNWRYVAAHPVVGAYRLDPFVSACLPVLLVIATHGLAAVLRAIPADPVTVAVKPTVPAPVAAPVKAHAPAPKPAKVAPRSAGKAAADWHPEALTLLRDGLRPADVARAVKVHPSQVTRLKARMGGMGVANG